MICIFFYIMEIIYIRFFYLTARLSFLKRTIYPLDYNMKDNLLLMATINITIKFLKHHKRGLL